MIKRTIAVILLLSLIICSGSAASADRRGLFGELAKDEYADERLAGLDQVSEMLELSFVSEDGAEFEINQGYYAGDRVFIAYRISATTNLVALHEGAPDKGLEWDQVIEDWIPGDLPLTGYPDVDKDNQWLDGHGQRWLEFPYCHNEEYLELEDGTRLDFVAGTDIKLEDGTVVGWRECLIPADQTQDAAARTFVIPVSYGKAVKFQDYSTFRENFGIEYHCGVPVVLHHFE